MEQKITTLLKAIREILQSSPNGKLEFPLAMDQILQTMTPPNQRKLPVKVRAENGENDKFSILYSALRNLLENWRMFPFDSNVISSFADVVEKLLKMEGSELKMISILLLHATKSDDQPFFSTLLFEMLEEAYKFSDVDQQKLNQEIAEKNELAGKCISNIGIRKILAGVVGSILGREVALNELPNNVTFEYFHSDSGVQAFAGDNVIYLNLSHLVFRPDIVLIGLVAHEFCHVILRQILNDLNVSTGDQPGMEGVEKPEAGVLAERAIFGNCPKLPAVYPHRRAAISIFLHRIKNGIEVSPFSEPIAQNDDNIGCFAFKYKKPPTPRR